MLIAEIVEAMGEKSQRLKELKAQSPEVEEALHLADEYQQLLKELEAQCTAPATPIIVPYPVYPTYPMWRNSETYRFTITSGGTTTVQAVQ